MRVVTVIQSGGGGVGAGRRTRVIVGRSGPQGTGTGGGGATSLDELSDVVITNATTGEVLRYNGTSWVDARLAASDLTGLAAIATSGSATDLVSGTVGTARLASGTAGTATYLRGDQTWTTPALDDLSDVGLSATTSGDFLRYNGTSWTDTHIVAGDLGTGTADAFHFLAGDLTWQDAVPLDVACKNTTASTIAKGTPVYVTGSVGAGAVVEVAPADASAAATMPAIGLTTTELAANATGYVRVMGVLSGISTGSYSINQTTYVAAGGGLTTTRPTGSTTLVQNIGKVIRSNNNTGEILVMGPGRSNDVPNLIGTGYLASSGTASATTFLRGDQTWSGVIAANVSGLAAVATTGAYGDLSGQPSLAAIATSGSATDLVSGTVGTARLASGTAGASNFLRGDQTWSGVIAANVSGLAAVATTGAYSSLSGTPSLAAVATSGSASDLSTGTLNAARLPNLFPIYGTGASGDVTISSGTTVLTGDAHYSNLTVASGATLATAGYRVFVTGTLSGAGTISNNGVSTGNASGGSGGASGGIFAAAGSGGGGGTTNGTQASALTNKLGGSGGAGGNSPSGTGGAAQTGTTLVATAGGQQIASDLWTMLIEASIPSAQRIAGGAGGSGGAGNGTSTGGGGGGGGGGIVYVGARTVTFTGSIEAVGGNGGSRSTTSTGGGGGGGGGVVLVATASTSQTFTTSVAGGTGGAGNGSGTTSGGNGTAGTATVYLGVK